MKMTKKVFSAIAMAAMVATTVIPAVPVEAAATAIAGYNFDNGTGMSSSGIAGSTAPTVVQDAERGSVLKLAEGTSSKLVQKADDPSMGEYDMRIDKGTPSSLKFSNPFAGKSLSGATISFWVKTPDDTAAKNAAGLIGFISGDRTIAHPDKIYVDPSTGQVDPDKQQLEDAHGPFMFGITCAYVDPMGMTEDPLVYFAGLHHNSYNFNDPNGIFLGVGGKWQYVTVAMDNSSATVYVDGVAVEGEEYKNKRWNDGEVNGGTAGNVGQPKLMEFFSWSDTEAYIGFTGFSPTAEVYIDDLTFYDKMLTPGDVSALYETAKTAPGATVPVGNTSGGTSSNSSDKKQKDREEAERLAREQEEKAKAANKALTESVLSSLSVTGMPSGAVQSVTGIYRGDADYTSVQSALNGVILKDNYRLSDFVAMDINFGGTQPDTVAKISVGIPSGYDANNLVVTRINDDGTVSILKHTIEDGKIVAKTNHFSKFAIVNLEPGTPGSASSNLPKTGVVAGTVVAGLGTVSVLGGAVLLKRRKDEE